MIQMIEEKEIAPFIEGKNISLVASNLKFIDLYAKWDNDPAFRHVSRNFIPISPEAFKKFFEKKQPNPPNEIFLNIWHKKDQKLIGYIAFNHIQWANAIAGIGLVIGEKEYWGKDVGTEAVALFLDYGFNELSFFKITGSMFHVNVGSWRVAEKVGMTREIVLKKQAYVRGEYVDEYQYSMFKDEWQQKRKQFKFLLSNDEVKISE
jgi:[ribosomal protein S5]-alanine N-acetyltransferase